MVSSPSFPDPASLGHKLDAHLRAYGLEHFTSDAAYDAAQRAGLEPAILDDLYRLAEARRQAGRVEADRAFYDRMADPAILPLLYSQRYELYATVGPILAALLLMDEPPPARLLDVGCGVGLLTTFLASLLPRTEVIGVDRSAASVRAAQHHAAKLKLINVSFLALDIEQDPLSGPFDSIISLHTALQAEQVPGLPSADWTTFARSKDAEAQRAFEQQTGLGVKLDRLCAALAPHGKMIVFEKARQLARRVPLQRAFAARGLGLLRPALPLAYRTIEEPVEDGPLYVLGRQASLDESAHALPWDEEPQTEGEKSADEVLAQLQQAASASPSETEPLYETHSPLAQEVWARLPGKTVTQERTWQAPSGATVHAELGETALSAALALTYLYQATTFDQRQLVLVTRGQTAMLDQYYRELTQD